jgi:ribokinase
MPRVLVIGSANVDFTVAVPRLPREGETVSGGELTIAFGGKGANQAVAARRLGGEVRLVACLGQDSFGDQIAEQLLAEGIPGDGLSRVRDAATGTAVIMVDGEGRNQIAVAPGANQRLDPARVTLADLLWARVLLCQLETPLPTVLHALESARRLGRFTILNPAPSRQLPAEIFPLVDLLTPNEIEAVALTGVRIERLDDAADAGRRLLASGAGRVIVTLGGRGALLCDGDSAVHFPAFPVRVVDSVAAGDAFNGALAVGLAAGGSLEEAIPLANAAGALACTRRGAQPSLPHRSEVEEFLRQLKGESAS